MAKSDPHSTDSDVEELKAAPARDLHQAVREEGEEELSRPVASLFWSGLAAGLAINASLITEGALHLATVEGPARKAIVALGYPIGFLVVILGRMQLFTESTITAMLPLVTKPSWWSLSRTLRLWGVVLVANLAGTALAAGAIALGRLGNADLAAAMGEVSMRIVEHDAGATFVNAIPAGFMIAILAWSLPNAREQAFWVILAITYVVALAGFSHSIVGSDEVFLLVFTGKVGAWEGIMGSLVPAILGNLVGGAGIFALLAHAQVRGEMREDRI